MRAELRDLSERDYWVYGVSERDLEHTLRLAQSLVQTHFEAYRREEARVKAEQPELAADILDDVAYYTYIDAQYVWQFCLWRLQGILEGMIVHTFLRERRSKPFAGLRAKLDAMRAVGFSVQEADYDELLAWAVLRNALSHAPPEQARPGPLQEADVVEYRDLVVRVVREWRKEKPEHDTSRPDA